MTFKGHSRSSEMSRFVRARVISYYRSIVTTALSCIVSQIQPDTGRKSRNLCTPPVFSWWPRRWWPRRISQRYLVLEKLEWSGYRTVKKVWRHVKPFWRNTGAWQTDRRTDLLYQYRTAVLTR